MRSVGHRMPPGTCEVSRLCESSCFCKRRQSHKMRRTLRSIAPSPSSGPERRTKLDPSVSTFTSGIEAIPSRTILRTQLSACCIASTSNSLHHSDLVRHLCVQDLCCQEFNVVLPWGAILAIWNPHGEQGVLDLLVCLTSWTVATLMARMRKNVGDDAMPPVSRKHWILCSHWLQNYRRSKTRILGTWLTLKLR